MNHALAIECGDDVLLSASISNPPEESTMPFTISAGPCPGGHYAVFAIRLQAIQIAPGTAGQSPGDFATHLLGRQMDFIHALHELNEVYGIELRYLFDPASPHRVRIYYLVRFESADRDRARRKAQGLTGYFLDLLAVNFPYYRFAAIADPDALAYLEAPFPAADIAEITRREDLIPLDALRTTATKPLGFRSLTGGQADGPPGIYLAFPFSLHLDNMKRVCAVLMRQKQACAVSVCLRPYRLTRSDEAQLAERIHLCEKYAQLSLGSTDDPARLAPFLRKQADALHGICGRDLVELQDAAFLQKIQIAAADGPAPPSIPATVGACLTEHAGHPTPYFDERRENAFCGGYEVRTPADDRARRTALNNYRNMAFDNWIATPAPADRVHWQYLFDVSQAAAGFRLPFPVAAEFPGLDTIQHSHKEAPSDLSSTGIILGEHGRFGDRRPVRLRRRDRRRHAYIIGQTGTGKSTLLSNLVLQDIEAGNGVGLIDPHGELIEAIMGAVPAHRRDDVIYINPADCQRPVGVNLLEAATSHEKDFCVNYFIEIFDVLYDLRATGGPMFEMYMRNTLLLLLDQKNRYRPTVADAPRVFQDRKYRKKMLAGCKNPYVTNFWEKEAEKAGSDLSLPNIAPYITAKLSRFLYNDTIRAIIGQRKSTIDFRKLMDDRRILLVDLRKGLLGETNSHFLGMLVVGKLLAAALGRTEALDKTELPPFFLYVDEFQNLATAAFTSIFSEARKYGLALTVANQYIAQLPERITRGVLGNVGTILSFRLGAADAALLSDEFGQAASAADLMGLPNYNLYGRLLVNGDVSSPFNIVTRPPSEAADPKTAGVIFRNSRNRYGRDRDVVEKEIQAAWKGDKDDLDLELDLD